MHEMYSLWLKYKSEEEQLKALREEVEKVIVSELAEYIPTEGQKTVKQDGCKVTLKQDIYRKLDEAKLDNLGDAVPENLIPVKIKKEVDNTGFKWLRDNEPGYFKIFAPCVTEKPGKVSVKVEVL